DPPDTSRLRRRRGAGVPRSDADEPSGPGRGTHRRDQGTGLQSRRDQGPGRGQHHLGQPRQRPPPPPERRVRVERPAQQRHLHRRVPEPRRDHLPLHDPHLHGGEGRRAEPRRQHAAVDRRRARSAARPVHHHVEHPAPRRPLPPREDTDMRPARLHLLLAMILTVNLVGVGVLVARVGSRRPLVVRTAASTKLDTGAPDQLPGDISVAPDDGPGSGRPSSFLPGAARGDGTVFAKYDTDKDGTKIFKLDAAPYTWNVAPGVKKQAFAFNGTVPGPTIRVIEGDKVRVIVTNHLPTGTAVHWHGMVLPNKMDGVPGITQEPIQPGGTMTYEFVAVATGTHWYHSHWDGDQV